MHPSGFPVSCWRCGADEWEVRDRRLVRAVAEWFRTGQRVPRRTAECGRCGEPASSVAPLVPGPPGRRRGPRRLAVWPVQLAPWIYVAAAGLGVGAGIAVDAAIGWPWWTVPPLAMVAAWVGFSIPAVRRWSWRGPAGLGVALLEGVSPRHGWRREAELVRRMFDHPPFPLYGLPPSWRGPRSTGGWGATMGRVNRITLVHGGGGEAGTLVVETWNAPPEGVVPLLREEAAEELEFGPHGAPGRASERPSWEPITIRVDGEDVPFEFRRRGEEWAALGKIETAVLVVQARRFPVKDVELARIADTAPYVTGRPPSPPL